MKGLSGKRDLCGTGNPAPKVRCQKGCGIWGKKTMKGCFIPLLIFFYVATPAVCLPQIDGKAVYSGDCHYGRGGISGPTMALLGLCCAAPGRKPEHVAQTAL